MGVQFAIKVQAITDDCRGADYRRYVCYNWVLGMLVIIGFQVVTGGADYFNFLGYSL
jgi:hypothetical protein